MNSRPWLDYVLESYLLEFVAAVVEDDGAVLHAFLQSVLWCL